MTELITLEALVGRLAGYAINTNTTATWKGREIVGSDSFDFLRQVGKELAETENGVLHVRVPGPGWRHYIARNDISIDGSYCFEVA